MISGDKKGSIFVVSLFSMFLADFHRVSFRIVRIIEFHFFLSLFSPSTAQSSSTSYVRTLVTSTKYYSELSDDDLQSEATNASVSETLNGGGNSTIRNSATAGDFNNGNH